jgi:hypothetical protein
MVYVVYVDVSSSKRSSVLEVSVYQICVLVYVYNFGEAGSVYSFLRA